MIISDPIGDMLTRVRNAALARKKTVELPSSKIKVAVAKLLVREGYLVEAQEKIRVLRLTLAYEGKEPLFAGARRISKPGLRWYVNKKNIPVVMGGVGIAIMSTPQGVMSSKDAKAKGIGGEVLCEVW